jgi:hypothetical protein
MSEKIYTRLFRLYPSRFRKAYENEALRLIRDRLRDETGFFKRARLWWDLVMDVFAGLPQAYRNSYAVTVEAPASANTEGIPSFRMLDNEPLKRGSILIGSTLSLTTIVAFGFLMSRSIGYIPLSISNGRMSPIEAVVERLNRPTTPDPAAGGADEATKSASVGASESQSRPAAALPENTKRRDFATSVKVPANGLTANIPVASRDANPVMKHDQSLIPLQQLRLQNASSGMIRLFDTHDIVMFGEVHDSEQEYQWLSKLVKTPGFSDHVDDIVVEFGNALYQKTVDRYVAGEDVPFVEVQKAWRNMVGDALPVSPEYGWLYKAVREANMEHPGKRGIRLVMGSPPADWDKIRSLADLAPYEGERDQWYARVVKTEVLAKHHHALLIMGAGHLLRGQEEAVQYENAAEQHSDLPPLDRIKLRPGYVEREILAAGANPYLVVFGTNAVNDHGDVDRRFDSWPVPVLLPLSGNWVGALPAQPVLSGGHAPPIPLTLADQADALLYVAPCGVLQTLYLSPAEPDGKAYAKEMTRRDIIEFGHPVAFPHGALPQCVQPQQSSR